MDVASRSLHLGPAKHSHQVDHGCARVHVPTRSGVTEIMDSKSRVYARADHRWLEDSAAEVGGVEVLAGRPWKHQVMAGGGQAARHTRSCATRWAGSPTERDDFVFVYGLTTLRSMARRT